MSDLPEWVRNRPPSGAPGTAQIRLLIELLLHVRMNAPDHFGPLVASVRDLSTGSAELLERILDGRDYVQGSEAGECWRADSDGRAWDDLLYVLSTYGVVDPTADERERWDEGLAEVRRHWQEVLEEMGEDEP